MIIIYKYRIELVTFSNIVEFVKMATEISGKIELTDDSGFCVSGKSLLGAMATVEWKSLYCVSETDIYSRIQKFCVE